MRWTPAKGLAMGLADVVPGVSGGTMALMLGVHPRLVAALRALGPAWLLALLGGVRKEGRPRARQAWQEADTSFLFLLGLGLAAGVLVGAKTLVHLLEAYPMAMAAFFFGLILASARVPYAMMPTRGRPELLAFVPSLFVALWTTVLSHVQAPQGLWFLPVAGAIAICAMILPGISGAFLLLLMGLYDDVLGAIGGFDLVRLAVFGAGALVGLLAFSRVLHRFLHTWPGPTLAALTGLMLGSLGRVWPFKDGMEFAEGANTAPPDAVSAGVALLAALLGAALVVLLQRLVGGPPALPPAGPAPKRQ